ncbi:cryptochrome/photolyase family protein [Elioraea rosea]|uniref:cryptochrome/photolyase family protein n=1 Tax=Elioraea rosea TaxID=2492390 RepID=UPI001183DA1A|nr:cryptochrome/photolyase family protein [Elioraea rosea]
MAGGTLRVVLGDQLTRGLSALDGLDPASDTVLMAEVMGECTYVPHHKAKIALVLSAMRHHAAALEAEGVRVDYVRLDDPANSGSLSGEVARAVRGHRPDRIVATEPGEWRVLEAMRGWECETGTAVEIRPDRRFIASREDFASWAKGRKSLRMEFFYREMRRRTGLLMVDGEPAGGAWNFDAENRKPLPKGLRVPAPPRFEPDAITRNVIALVSERFGGNFGALEAFNFPVSIGEAQAARDAFIRDRLPSFGDYQDAMAEGEAFLFHSLLSTSLNLGLLDPLEVCRAAEAAWREGRAPLNAVEGFIRQIIGWREYVRGLYWHLMPRYATLNALGADRALPGFYWTADSGMACIDAVVSQTRDHAYAHHIQRLMVTGNFALLAGIDPDEINAWYLAVYADAFEWVELPNTHGMAIHADGGIMASKPYAASGKYIDRMSDHCRSCRHDVRQATGPQACPFNALYWNFLARHRDRFEGNPRMAQMYRTMDRMDAGKVAAMRRQAEAFLDRVAPRRAGRAA